MNGHIQCGPTDANCAAWYDATHMWSHFLQSKGTSIWIMYCNFFFGCLPGILYASNIIYILSLDEGEEVVVAPHSLSQTLDMKTMTRWFAYIFLFFPVVISIFQLAVFDRFIGIRLTRTFFAGQLFGCLLYVLAASPVAVRIGLLFRGLRLRLVNIIVAGVCVLLSVLLFIIYVSIPHLSELSYNPQTWKYNPIVKRRLFSSQNAQKKQPETMIYDDQTRKYDPIINRRGRKLSRDSRRNSQKRLSLCLEEKI